MIRFERFCWRFAGAQTWALSGVSLGIERGEFVAVVGPSGSGKSTLAAAMCGLLLGRQAGECAGRVCLAGRNVAESPLHEVAATIGLVQQNPEAHFATMTVSDEIAFGMENHCLAPADVRSRSAESLELLGIHDLRNRELATLSGGEQQRVAVASIIAGKPDVLVLDEPTASLDPGASQGLFHSLTGLCRNTGLTVVIIEHKLAQLLPLKPRLLCLDEGRVVGDHAAGTVGAHRGAGPSAPLPAKVTDRAGSSTPQGPPLVDVAGVTVQLGGHKVLRDVSLRVHRQEVIAIMGPNGGGKTTLLHTLLGLLVPERGTICLQDKPVVPRTVSRLAHAVGMVFQNADHQLMADSVWCEAIFAMRNLKMVQRGTEEEAKRLLDRAGLAARRSDHPFRLSWGQKRRLNLISSVLHRPRLLLLDEPFAGQDWDNVSFLLEVIHAVLGAEPGWSDDGGACLMVTHDPRIVTRACTRILFLAEGRIVVDAPVSPALERLRAMGHEAYTPPPIESHDAGG